MPNSDVETALCDALESAGRDYEQAVRRIESISQGIARGDGREQAYGQLQQIAVSTRETETRVAQLRDTWSRLNRRPGGRLERTLQRQETILRDLIRSLDEAEQVARSARGEVVQAVDEQSRSHRMHLAYAHTIRQAAE